VQEHVIRLIDLKSGKSRFHRLSIEWKTLIIFQQNLNRRIKTSFQTSHNIKKLKLVYFSHYSFLLHKNMNGNLDVIPNLLLYI
jgi:hypothetical protein